MRVLLGEQWELNSRGGTTGLVSAQNTGFFVCVCLQACLGLALGFWLRGIPGGSHGKESACNAGRSRFDPWTRKIPWRRECLPTPVFLPGESHGQRSLEGASPWGPIEWDMTESLAFSPFSS